MLDHKKIISQALDITFRFKFLWSLGLLLFLGKAGIIWSVVKIKEKEAVDYDKVSKVNKQFIGRITGVSLARAFLLITTSFILLAPPYVLWELGMAVNAKILFIVALIILVPLFIIISLTAVFSFIFITLGNMGFGRGLKSSFELFFKNWSEILPLSLIVFLIDFVVIYTVVLTLPFGLIILALAGVVSAWQTVVWTLAFLELVRTEKPEKTEEKLMISPAPTVD